jgi:aspartate ammonia-lyase
MMPVINYNLLQSLEIFRNAVRVFTEKCIKGIKADRKRCKELAEKSIGLATVLNPFIGYEKAAAVAREAVATGKTIREIVFEKRILSKKEIDKILDPMAMTRPRFIKKVARIQNSESRRTTKR